MVGTGVEGNGALPELSLLEAQLQATLNLAPAYAWYAQPSGALSFVNERSAAEWDSDLALLHPDDRQETRRVWANYLRTKLPDWARRHARANGR